MRTLILNLWIGISFISLYAGDSFARDMQGRMGIGYNAEFANAYTSGFRAPAVSAKYGLSRDLAIEGVVGFASLSPINTVLGVKGFKNLFYEPSLNFYFMSGLGFLGENGQGGVEVMGGFGVEYFIPGVDSLGFSMETGISLDNGSGTYALKTLGVSFLDAGIHFYF